MIGNLQPSYLNTKVSNCTEVILKLYRSGLKVFGTPSLARIGQGRFLKWVVPSLIPKAGIHLKCSTVLAHLGTLPS